MSSRNQQQVAGVWSQEEFSKNLKEHEHRVNQLIDMDRLQMVKGGSIFQNREAAIKRRLMHDVFLHRTQMQMQGYHSETDRFNVAQGLFRHFTRTGEYKVRVSHLIESFIALKLCLTSEGTKKIISYLFGSQKIFNFNQFYTLFQT
jgi:hypothetical protein